MNAIEAVAAALGVVNVALVVRRSIWNYPFGIAMVSLYAFVFFEAKLYSDTLLQIFFVAVNVYGWLNWRRSQAEAGEVRVERLTVGTRWVIAMATAAAVALWGAMMHRLTDAALPWADAAIAGMSVAAQLLMARRYWENWVLWIAVDVLAIGVFAARGLYVTSALYMLFLLLAVLGLRAWLKARAA